LSFFADRAAIDTAAPDNRCTGTYTFELSQLPPWMGFGKRAGRAVVRGVMRKTPLQEKLNETEWARQHAAFPGYFSVSLLTPLW
jgi:hypothetical protein